MKDHNITLYTSSFSAAHIPIISLSAPNITMSQIQQLYRIDSEGSLLGRGAPPRSAVSFGKVQVQEHAMILGDNPSTSCGPSVELDWELQSTTTYDTVDEYELQRSSSSSIRRSEKQLVMSSRTRVQLLLDNGFTFREIKEETAKRGTKVKALSRQQVANVLKRYTKWKKDRVDQRVKQREQRNKAILDSL